MTHTDVAEIGKPAGRLTANCTKCHEQAFLSDEPADLDEWQERHRDCGVRGIPPEASKTRLLTSAVESLMRASEIVNEVFKDEPSDARAQILGATRELAKLGKLRMCDVPWCESSEPNHREHRYDQTVTSKSGNEHLEIGTVVDLRGDYDDEIQFRAWFREGANIYETVSVYLTEPQAREVITAIELAIVRRAELRGAK